MHPPTVHDTFTRQLETLKPLEPMNLPNDSTKRDVLLGIFLACHVIAILVMAAVPPVSRDALTHHLAVPKLWLQHGGIYEIPDLPFSYYPMNLDLLYTIPLMFGNDIVPKYIHFAFALATAWLIFTYLNKRFGRSYALSGALFFLTIPVVVKLSISVYVDLGLVFFTTLSWVYLFKWAETGFRWPPLIIASLACGLALGTKYNGLISLFLLAFITPYLYIKHCPQDSRNRSARLQLKAIGYGAVFVGIACLVYAPWMIRNAVWTGNPVYPLYKKHFHAKPSVPEPAWLQADSTDDETNHDNQASRGIKSHFEVRRWVYGEAWWQTASIPVRIFFQGRDDDPKFFDGRLNPFLFLLPLLLVFGTHGHTGWFNREMPLLAGFSVLYVLLVFFRIDMRIRWVSPMIPPLVILSMAGLSGLGRFCRSRFGTTATWLCHGLVWTVVAAMVALNVIYTTALFKRVDPWGYLTGRVDRNTYIERFLPEYAALSFANRFTPPDSVILCLFLGNRRYYSDREMNFDYAFFKNVIRKSGSPRLVSQRLNDQGLTHILIRQDLFGRWTQDSFTPAERHVMASFFSEFATPLFSKNGYTLMRLEAHGRK